MKHLKIVFTLIVLGVILCFKNASNSEKLNAIIAKYEAKREYDFERNESVGNTIRYYEAEADFARSLMEEMRQVSNDGLSESELISKELLLFVLQD